MTTILTAVVGVVLAAGTVVGVTKAVSDDTQRVTPGTAATSTVVPYGDR